MLDADLDLTHYYFDRTGRDANASELVPAASKPQASPLLAHTVHRFLPRGVEIVTGAHSHATADVSDEHTVRKQIETIRLGRWRAHRGKNESLTDSGYGTLSLSSKLTALFYERLIALID